MEMGYQYIVYRERELLVLIRLGPVPHAQQYVFPGVWKESPHLNDLRFDPGCQMDYREVTEEEAEEIRLQLQAEYDSRA